MPEMRQVFSSHIDSVGYDPDTSELHVRYQNGKTSVHEQVPPETANNVLGAVSIGQAIHEHVRGKFPHRYL